jgi:hypothetical protein
MPSQPAAGGDKLDRNQNRSRRGTSADSKVQTFRSPTAVVVWVVWLLFAVGNWIDLAAQGRDHVSLVAAAILLLVTGFAYVTAWRPRIIADEAGVTVRNPLRDHRIGWARVTKVDVADLLRVHCATGATAAMGATAATNPAESSDPGDAGRKKRDKVISSWAVHYSRRRQLAAEAKARRPGRSSFGMPSRGLSLGAPSGAPFGAPVDAPSGARVGAPVDAPAAAASPEAEAEKIVRILTDRVTAAHAADSIWPADETGGTQETPATAGWLDPLTSTWSGQALAAIGVPALILLIVCLV